MVINSSAVVLTIIVDKNTVLLSNYFTRNFNQNLLKNFLVEFLGFKEKQMLAISSSKILIGYIIGLKKS